METQTTNLRQAENKVRITGILAEKDLHEGKNQSNSKTTIEGYVSIKVDDINQIRLNVRADETKKDGAPNPAYKNLTDFNSNSQSIAEVGEEDATRVYIGSAQLNPYHSTQSGNDVISYRTSFISIAQKEKNFEPYANGEVEVYIQSIVPEMDKDGDETGRALVRGLMPTFSGIEPVVFIAPSGDGFADQVISEFETGQTVRIFFDVKNSRVEIVKEIPVKLGKPRKETTVSYTNELIITGMSEPYDDSEDSIHAPYDANAIKTALQEREDRIKSEANKPKGNGNTQTKPSGASKGRTPQGW